MAGTGSVDMASMNLVNMASMDLVDMESTDSVDTEDITCAIWVDGVGCGAVATREDWADSMG